jgi:ATP-dependent RNA helicase RhlE
MTFSELGFDEPILRAIADKGYSKPSPIQTAAIPGGMARKDLMASAQTGTGKTAAFVLPILQHLHNSPRPEGNRGPQVLILTPTRELAAQINQNIEDYGKYLSVQTTVVFGGVNINPQMKILRRGVDILVATPGRLLDLHNQRAVSFDKINTLVLDEADRMLDMGFIHDIKRILGKLPAKRHSMMFSATFSPEIRSLAKTFLKQPEEVDVAPRNTTVETVSQLIHPVDKKSKPQLLCHLIKYNRWRQVLVFSRTKHGANKLVKDLLKANIAAVAIHGNKSQAHRTRALKEFKAGEVDVMVATDIAARGIDIAQLPHVINVDLPHVPEDYVHRIGRTGRAGETGQAISLVSADELKQLRDIERLTRQTIKRVEIEGFEPFERLGESRGSTSKPQPRKPQAGRQKPPGQDQNQRTPPPRSRRPRRRKPTTKVA